MSPPLRRTILAAGLAVGALRFAFRPDAVSPAGAALFLGEILLLFALALRYARRVERTPPLAIAGFLAGLLALVGTAEIVSMKSGLLGGGYAYGAPILDPAIGGVPLLVLLAWALFGLLSGMTTRVLLGERPPRRPGDPARPPALWLAIPVNGVIMLGIDLAVEWHFSGAAGFWSWRPEEGSRALIDGVPAGNFILWFLVGCAVPLLEKVTGMGPRGRKGVEAARFALRTAPALGYALLLAAGIPLDLAASAPLGALACSAGCVAVTARLGGLARAARRRDLKASG